MLIIKDFNTCRLHQFQSKSEFLKKMKKLQETVHIRMKHGLLDLETILNLMGKSKIVHKSTKVIDTDI